MPLERLSTGAPGRSVPAPKGPKDEMRLRDIGDIVKRVEEWEAAE